MLLGPSVFAAPFLKKMGFFRKFGDSASNEQNATEEPEVMKEIGDT